MFGKWLHEHPSEERAGCVLNQFPLCRAYCTERHEDFPKLRKFFREEDRVHLHSFADRRNALSYFPSYIGRRDAVFYFGLGQRIVDLGREHRLPNIISSKAKANDQYEQQEKRHSEINCLARTGAD